MVLEAPARLLEVGQALQLRAEARDGSGSAVSGARLEWGTSDKEVAKVDGEGRVTGVGVGSTTIWVRSGSVSDSVGLAVHLRVQAVGSSGGTVSARGDSVSLAIPAGAIADQTPISIAPATDPPTSPGLIPGTVYDLGPDGIRFQAPVALSLRIDPASLPPGVSVTDLRLHKRLEGRWIQLAESGADASTGVVTGHLNGFSTYAVLTAVVSVEVTPDTAVLTEGGTRQFSAVLRDATGTVLPDREVAWSSSDLPRVSVSESGLASAVAVGSAVVRASSGEHSDTATVTVSGGSGGGTSGLSGKIAFQSYLGSDHFQSDIYTVKADGTGLTRLTTNESPDGSPVPDTEAAWSPDGTRIAFRSARVSGSGVYVMNADGSGIAPVDVVGGSSGKSGAASYSPSWSPDGKRIALQRWSGTSDDIFAVAADGTGATQLTTDPAGDGYAAWSPDGSRIAFVSDRSGDREIYVMNADGSNVVRLTNNPGGFDVDPAWSPDGSRIVFASYREGAGDVSWTDLYVMNADGTGVKRLTTGARQARNPTWSPDGTKIAFDSLQDGPRTLYVVNVDGSGLGRILTAPGTHSNPSWAP